MTELLPAKQRLIILTHEFAPFRGGVATYTQEVAAAWQRSEKNVEVWAPDYGLPPYNHQCDPFPFPVVRLRAGGSLRLNDWSCWTRALAARRSQLASAQVILASVGAHTAWLVLNAFRCVRNHHVISILHGSEVLRFEKNPLWRILARRFYRQLGQVVTVSEFSKSLIQKSFIGAEVKKIMVAPCAASTAAAQPVNPISRSDEKIRILTLARLHPRKGQLDTAHALANLSVELRRKIVYQVGGAGDSHYLRQVENTCRSAAIEFHYLGPINPAALARTYAQCDLYAMTSRTLPNSVEGFGLTYLEAGCHGKPVIGYRSGGAAEAVRDGETGLLATEGDLPGLAAVFTRLIENPPLREKLGEANRQWAARFNWAITARVLANISDAPSA